MKPMPKVITKEFLLEQVTEIGTLYVGDYLRREPKYRRSYEEAMSLIEPQIEDRKIWFHLPGANDQILFALMKALEIFCGSFENPQPFPVFQKDHPQQVGVQFIGLKGESFSGKDLTMTL